MKLYKLTNERDISIRYNLETGVPVAVRHQWGPGVTHTTDGQGDFETEHLIHAYRGSNDDPEAGALLAVLMTPSVGMFSCRFNLWECDGDIDREVSGLRVGCTSLTTLEKIPVPLVTGRQRAALGILCSLQVCQETAYVRWARNWLKKRLCWTGGLAAARPIPLGKKGKKWAVAKAASEVGRVTENKAAWLVTRAMAECDTSKLTLAVEEAAMTARIDLPVPLLVRMAMSPGRGGEDAAPPHLTRRPGWDISGPVMIFERPRVGGYEEHLRQLKAKREAEVEASRLRDTRNMRWKREPFYWEDPRYNQDRCGAMFFKKGEMKEIKAPWWFGPWSWLKRKLWA